MSLVEKYFELNRGGKSNLTAMEGMRGIAAMVVFLVHFESMFRGWFSEAIYSHGMTHFLVDIGHVGVDLFFILSGYLIYGSLVKVRPFSVVDYVKARGKRLYPVFLAVFVVVLLGHLMGLSNANPLPESTVEKIAYLGANLSLHPYIFGYTPMIDVAWTLAYEVTFYALAPICLVTFGLRHLPPWARQAVLIMMLLLGGVAVFSIGGPGRFGLFIVGALLYEWHRVGEKSGNGWFLYGGMAILILSVALSSLDVVGGKAELLGIMLGGALFVWGGLSVSSFLMWSPLRYFGNMSYSYYLSHSVSLQIGMLLLAQLYPPDGNGGWGTFLALGISMLIFTTLGSVILYLVIERPFSLRPAKKKRSRSSSQTVSQNA